MEPHTDGITRPQTSGHKSARRCRAHRRALVQDDARTAKAGGSVNGSAWWWVIPACLLMVGSGGCRNMETPRWFRPGTAPEQQIRAEQFDPYPDPVAGPELTGARPPGAESPMRETERVRRKPWSWTQW